MHQGGMANLAYRYQRLAWQPARCVCLMQKRPKEEGRSPENQPIKPD
jgi:hypothetical protein